MRFYRLMCAILGHELDVFSVHESTPVGAIHTVYVLRCKLCGKLYGYSFPGKRIYMSAREVAEALLKDVGR